MCRHDPELYAEFGPLLLSLFMPLVRAVEDWVFNVTFLVLLIFIIFDDLRKERSLLRTRQLWHYEKPADCAMGIFLFRKKDLERMKCVEKVSQKVGGRSGRQRLQD